MCYCCCYCYSLLVCSVVLLLVQPERMAPDSRALNSRCPIEGKTHSRKGVCISLSLYIYIYIYIGFTWELAKRMSRLHSSLFFSGSVLYAVLCNTSWTLRQPVWPPPWRSLRNRLSAQWLLCASMPCHAMPCHAMPCHALWRQHAHTALPYSCRSQSNRIIRPSGADSGLKLDQQI